MSIKLITGLPGSGKSLLGVDEVRKAVDAGRPTYVDGLDGLVPFGWEPCDANAWQDLPDGSLVVFDEAQKKWGTRRTAEPPEHIRALSEHRHRGFDFVLITQHPTMLDAYVRKLVNGHRHLLRQFGAEVSKVFGWQECQDDPQSQGTRDRGTVSIWRYPHELFPLYKSATLHTVKRKLPARVYGIAALVLLLGVAAWFGYGKLSSIERTAAKANAAAVPAKSESQDAKAPPRNAAEYVERITPRVLGMPWSAPLFDDRKPKAEPDILCVDIQNAECRCYSEQITPIRSTPNVCKQIARHGVYNPYRDPLGTKAQQEPQHTSADKSAARSRDGGDLKVSGDAPEGKPGVTAWPRPDFSYKVPFPSVGAGR